MHGLPGTHLLAHALDEAVRGLSPLGGILASLAPLILNALTGIMAGGLVFLAVKLTRGIMKKGMMKADPFHFIPLLRAVVTVEDQG